MSFHDLRRRWRRFVRRVQYEASVRSVPDALRKQRLVIRVRFGDGEPILGFFETVGQFVESIRQTIRSTSPVHIKDEVQYVQLEDDLLAAFQHTNFIDVHLLAELAGLRIRLKIHPRIIAGSPLPPVPD